MRTPEEMLADLLAKEARGESIPVLAFYGHTAKADGPGTWVLSNWWPSPFEVEGVSYSDMEMFLMAEKARLFCDADALEDALSATDPSESKAAGRRVRGFDDNTWKAHRFEIALRGLRAKFTSTPELREYLLSSAPSLIVEAAPRDRVWGVWMGPGNPLVTQPSQWRGLNLLGLALTCVRDDLDH
jgi:ribA/ribD-fused uncharacterized protein